MALEKYNKKRDFTISPEPKGKKQKSTKNLHFVIQHHKATREHYDLRLEHNGILLSWAVPKGLSLNKDDKRLAVMVEDHPLEYRDFEGIIPNGNYGAGSVKIYDSGYYTQNIDFNQGLKKGHLKFTLNGKLLKGEWNLVKTDEKNWIIIKSNDKYESKKTPIKNSSKNPFKTISPMLATLSQEIPSGKDWIYEIKYDGYRVLAFIENKKAKLLSRNQKNITSKFENISKDLQKLAKDIPMILDGEVVCFDKNGRSDFGLLQQAIKTSGNNFVYVVFDLLAYNGKDLKSLPLKQRKDMLNKIIPTPQKSIMLSSTVNSNGKKCFEFAQKLGLEGIVAKKINSTYEQARSPNWLKIKCYKRQEFVIGGYSVSDKNEILSAILVGYYNKNKFIYIGKVGTGFSENDKKDLIKKFKPIYQDKSPFSNFLKGSNVFWLTPKLVAEIKYTEITKQNLLRQPSFIALRKDKNPKSVVLEEQV